ncbi:MAG: hypothetical protein ABEN55_12930 [Bradymonadaceae bacterium]
MDLTYKIVRRLLRDDEVGFSRNKNFDAYEDPTVQRAVRIYHHLESIEEDLLELAPGGDVILDAVDRNADDRLALKLTFGDSEARRVAYLKPREWALLLENDRVSSILRKLIQEADEHTRRVIEESFETIDNWN